jgi:hypothetical protein
VGYPGDPAMVNDPRRTNSINPYSRPTRLS